MPTIGLKRTYSVLEVAGESNVNHKKQNTLGDNSSISGSQISVDSEKRLRAAMIRTRFAETILRSQQNKILNESNKAEKERLKKKKAQTEAGIRAAMMELKKMQRPMNRKELLRFLESEREMARLAIEKIQRTVEWNDALYVTQEFEKLIGVQTGPVRSFTRDCVHW